MSKYSKRHLSRNYYPDLFEWLASVVHGAQHRLPPVMSPDFS
jgi:hypothetical protein